MRDIGCEPSPTHDGIGTRPGVNEFALHFSPDALHAFAYDCTRFTTTVKKFHRPQSNPQKISGSVDECSIARHISASSARSADQSGAFSGFSAFSGSIRRLGSLRGLGAIRFASFNPVVEGVVVATKGLV